MDAYNLRPRAKTHNYNTRDNSKKIGDPNVTVHQKGIWNERSRPGWDENTYQEVLEEKTEVDFNEKRGYPVYECPACGSSYPRKSDLEECFPQGIPKSESWITIDHLTNWKEWIYSKASILYNGTFLLSEVKKSYNDKKNLAPLCNRCNSAKNGPKNVFD